MNIEQARYAANRIPIYSYTNEHLHGFYISLFLKSGIMYEKEEENGVTHFIEHLAIRNVNHAMNGELYPTLDRYGLEFNASTYSEMVQFYISGADKNFRIAAEIISKLLLPIELPREDIDTERDRIKAEIREVNDKSSLSTFTAECVWGGTTLSRPITGTNKSVGRLTRKRLEAYRRRSFTSDNLFFYVTGNVSDNDIDYLSELVGEYALDTAEANRNIAPVPNNFGNRGGDVRLKGADFTKVRFTFDLDMSAFSVAELDLLYDMTLGGYNSNFFLELSEKRGLFYDLSGAIERYKNIGELYFSYEVRECDLEEAVSLTVKILNDFKKTLHAPDSLMKSGYVDNAYMLYDDARELNFTFAYDNHIMELGYRSLDERIAVYESVSAEDIRRTAQKIFTPENLTLTLKGNKKKINVQRLDDIISAL